MTQVIRLDTLDKKPKLWNVAALTAALAVAVGALILTGAHEHAVAISVLFDVYYFTVAALLVRAFIRQIRYADAV